MNKRVLNMVLSPFRPLIYVVIGVGGMIAAYIYGLNIFISGAIHLL